MSDAVKIWEKPDTDANVMIVGWRQWADAGSLSSLLPKYLIQETDAHKIGEIKPDGFYMFQIPGTHDLVRPVVQFNQGYPESLETKHNDLYYARINEHGVLYLLGDEPHLDIDRYINAVLHIAKSLNVRRVIGLGGVYAEVPYNKERRVSCSYSLRRLKEELDAYAVDLTNYHGGASIGSYLCRRAGDEQLEYIGFYAFSPTYDFSQFSEQGGGFRVENDFQAWLGVMRRVNHMLKLKLDLRRNFAGLQQGNGLAHHLAFEGGPIGHGDRHIGHLDFDPAHFDALLYQAFRFFEIVLAIDLVEGHADDVFIGRDAGG